MPGAIRYVLDRHARKPIGYTGCKNVTKSPESVQADKEGVLVTGLAATLLGWVGVEIGPNPWINWLSQFPAKRPVVPRWVISDFHRAGVRL